MKHSVFLRGSGREFKTVGPKAQKDFFPKRLRREARNCQQRVVKKVQRPRGTVWSKKVRKYVIYGGILF